MNRHRIKIGVVAALALAVAAFFVLDLQQYASLAFIKSQQHAAQSYYAEHRLFVLAAFGFVYVVSTALSLPVSTALTLSAGALFGFTTGLIVVSFASSIGATLAFLIARFLFKDSVQQKYGKHLRSINEGFANEGVFYLFALRLVPILPFFIVNILMGLLPISVRGFYAASQIGMLPGTAVYVYAGTELGKLTSLSGIVSPSMLLAFVLLGLFPLLARKVVHGLRQRREA